MTTSADEMFAEAQRLHASGDIAAGQTAALRALAIDPDHVPSLEFLATALVTRKRQYVEGLEFIDRAADARPDDPGVWYARGWCYEFAAHELRRRSDKASTLEPMSLYSIAAESFRRCLSLHPEGKLLDDAQDLLDHVENELAQ